MPNYTYYCMDCGHQTVANFSFEKRPTTTPCEACGEIADYRITATNVMRTALPDGTKREGFAELREASKLNKESIASADKTRKKEIKEEIKKLGVQITKDVL